MTFDQLTAAIEPVVADARSATTDTIDAALEREDEADDLARRLIAHVAIDPAIDARAACLVLHRMFTAIEATTDRTADHSVRGVVTAVEAAIAHFDADDRER